MSALMFIAGFICGVAACGWWAGFRRALRTRQIDRALENVRREPQRPPLVFRGRETSVIDLHRRKGA